MQYKFEKVKNQISFLFLNLGEVVILRQGTLTFESKILNSFLQFLTIESCWNRGFASVKEETVKPRKRRRRWWRSGAHVLRVRGSEPRVSKQGRMVGPHVAFDCLNIVLAGESCMIWWRRISPFLYFGRGDGSGSGSGTAVDFDSAPWVELRVLGTL